VLNAARTKWVAGSIFISREKAVGRRVYLYVAGACLAVLLLVMLFTQPESVRSVVLAVPFLLIFASLFLASFSLLKAKLPTLRSIWVSFFVSSFPVVLLALASLGQLRWGDVLTLTVLYSVAYFYMSRASSTNNV
jgi:hypothetical protein